MAGAPGIPVNFFVQTANAQVLASWNQSAGATSYIVQRSLDNVTYTTLATVSGSPLANSYLDTTVTPGVQYWYQVAASSSGGTSPYTQPGTAIPTLPGEQSLGAIRLAAQQTADRVNSQFITVPEWNSFINLAMYELYDLLITTYEDYFMCEPIQFTADGTTFWYDMPNGITAFTNGITQAPGYIAPAVYKLAGIDLSLNNANNGYVTINKFNFIDRNRFVYPNTASTIYGVFNLQYRMINNKIMFIPTPSAGQGIRVWYVPRLKELLQDTDITNNISISGWIRYVIVRAAKYALDKEESDTARLTEELVFLKQRIEESAANKDQGQPDKISDTRSGNGGSYGSGGLGSGWFGGTGGF